MPQWRWFITQLTRRIWFRAALIGTAAVALALVAPFIAPVIPYEFGQIGSSAVDNVLTVLASSMLAVTTFSLTAMVTAFSGASQSGTPRATELLVEDAAAQNALSTFLGAFLFSIVGIIALKTGFYGVQGRAVLLIGTVIVILIIVVVLFHWIGQLTHFGRMGDTIERVERKARVALRNYGGPLHVDEAEPRHSPEDAALEIMPTRSGYIAHVDRDALVKAAENFGSRVHLVAPAGTFVTRDRAIAWLAERPTDTQECEELADAIRRQLIIADERDFDQDPRFGIVVLGEIASRALSPAVNDPGTAIAVLGAGMRVFDRFLDRLEEEQAEEAQEAATENGDGAPQDGDADGEPLVDEPGLSLAEIVQDLVRPIARDGAGLIEVHLRLQDILAAIHTRVGARTGAFRELARDCLDRAVAAIDHAPDVERLRAAHADAFDATPREPPGRHER